MYRKIRIIRMLRKVRAKRMVRQTRILSQAYTLQKHRDTGFVLSPRQNVHSRSKGGCLIEVLTLARGIFPFRPCVKVLLRGFFSVNPYPFRSRRLAQNLRPVSEGCILRKKGSCDMSMYHYHRAGSRNLVCSI